ncbi:alpha/beta fold hydrolase [bacterium]|nr:alpha/beta fold hydrolase [bacterium]
MKRIIFYLIILKKALLLFIYNIFRQKNRLCVQLRKSIENYLFFQPSKFRAVPLQRDLLGKFKPIRFLTSDRVKLYSWFIEPKQNMPTILYLHGQAESILKHQNVARFCLGNGFGLFLLSYRGHYKSGGHATEKGVYTDAQSAVEKLKELGVDTKNIIIWGHSLGTVTALETAMNNEVKGIILQSPIKDIKTAAIDVNNFYCRRIHLPTLTAINREIIMNTEFVQKFDAMSKIKRVKCPILILHSKTDRIAPYTNSIELAQNNPDALLKIFDRGTHWDCAWCINSILEFIKSLEHNKIEKAEV